VKNVFPALSLNHPLVAFNSPQGNAVKLSDRKKGSMKNLTNILLRTVFFIAVAIIYLTLAPNPQAGVEPTILRLRWTHDYPSH
jgi:hypothetical protein